MNHHPFLDKLNGLHGEEERLRVCSLASIQGNSVWMDHVRMIEAGMDLVIALGRGFAQPTSTIILHNVNYAKYKW